MQLRKFVLSIQTPKTTQLISIQDQFSNHFKREGNKFSICRSDADSERKQIDVTCFPLSCFNVSL